MREEHLVLSINVRFTLVALFTLLLHSLLLFPSLPQPKLTYLTDYHSRAVPVTRLAPGDLDKIRKIGRPDGIGQNRVLAKNKGIKGGLEKSRPNPFKTAGALNQLPSSGQATSATRHPYRPTTRPSALDQLSLKAEPVQQVATRTQHAGSQMLAGSPTLSKSLMNMQVEVPEGVIADELNEFELQFYGFQNRLVSKYLNSIELQVREYEKRYSLPTLNVSGKHTMTGRVTFDTQGNIKQIKMIRWTQADKLQAMFEDILKSMISLPNPPKMLRNSQGEIVVFYTLTVNNT